LTGGALAYLSIRHFPGSKKKIVSRYENDVLLFLIYGNDFNQKPLFRD